MRKLQIVGLPGSGKTTGIKKFLQGHKDPVEYINISNFEGVYRERAFKQTLIASNINTLAESACGIYKPPTFVICVNTPINQVYENLKKRGDEVDEKYLSLLRTQIIPAHCTISTSDDLPDILKLILEA